MIVIATKRASSDIKPQKTLTAKKAIVYSLGIFGIQMFIGYINSYQSQFYTSILGAQLTVCAAIILVSKIISSFADPIIGNIIDRSNFKSGKMKPFVAMSALPLAFLTTIMFIKINFGSDVMMYAYITVTTVLWNIAMSFADIPSSGMLAVLSPDSDEKSAAAGISNTMKSVALVVPNGVIPVVCMLTKSASITEKEYLITAGIIAVLGLICYAVMLSGSKEVVKSQPNSMSIKSMFTELKENKMLLIVFLIYMLGFGRNIAVGIGVQTAAVVFDEVTIAIGSLKLTLAGENLPVLLGLGSGFTSLTSIVLAPIVAKRLGHKKTYLVFGVYGTIISTAAYILFVACGNTFRGFWGIFVMQFAIGLMFGTHFYIPLAMLSDIVDYREMQTGKRTEGIQYGVLSLAIKLSNAFSVAVGIFIVGLSGYVGTMTFAQVTPHMQNVVMAAYWLVPGICTGLSCIPILFYVIDDKTKARFREYSAKKEAVAK